MPPNVDIGSPEDWMRHARSDLALSKVEKPQNVLYEELCFHAQQAAEKSLKALLLSYNIEFPRTHNIRTLLDLVPEHLDGLNGLQDAAGLTEYAVETRYPAAYEEITEADYREAIELAQTIYNWTKHQIGL